MRYIVRVNHIMLESRYHIKGLIKRNIEPQVLKHPLSPSTKGLYLLLCYMLRITTWK